MPMSSDSSGLLSLASLYDDEKRRAESARLRAEAEQHERRRIEREAALAARERFRAERLALEQAESIQRSEHTRLQTALQTEIGRVNELSRTCEGLRQTIATERQTFRGFELRTTAKLLRARLVSRIALAFAFSASLAEAGFFWGVLRPHAQQALTRAEQAWSSEQRARSEALTEHARATRRIGELSALASKLEQDLGAVPAAPGTPKLSGHSSASKLPPEATPAKKRPCKDDGDPLNPCLGR